MRYPGEPSRDPIRTEIGAVSSPGRSRAGYILRRADDAMDGLDHFPRVWCSTCNKVQPLLFDVLKANDKNEHDSADIVCAECRSIIATYMPRTLAGPACATRRSRKRQRWRLRK